MSVASIAEAPVARASGRGLLARLSRHRLFATGALLLGAMLAAALLADVIAILPPDRMQFRLRFQPPGRLAWLGTDNYGRDVWSRVLHGAQLSLLIATTVAATTATVGTAIGLLAGYFRRLDGLLMRVMDALMAFPAVLLAIAVAAALGPSIGSAIIALSVVYTPRTVRVVRASVLVIRELDYVQAAVVCGAGDARIICKHVLPNSLTPLIVQTSFVFAYAILAESILSFLGVGPPPPTPTWGNMIAEGKDFMHDAWWIALFPGLAILTTAMAANFIGDGLRDALDPRTPIEPARG
jgi:peptide/nickel transport system permease protein